MTPSARDVAAIEQALYAAYRDRNDELAARLGALALRMRSELPFVCDIDESAGMAEVYDLQNYSRRV